MKFLAPIIVVAAALTLARAADPPLPAAPLVVKATLATPSFKALRAVDALPEISFNLRALANPVPEVTAHPFDVRPAASSPGTTVPNADGATWYGPRPAATPAVTRTLVRPAAFGGGTAANCWT